MADKPRNGDVVFDCVDGWEKVTLGKGWMVPGMSDDAIEKALDKWFKEVDIDRVSLPSDAFRAGYRAGYRAASADVDGLGDRK
jgi:hypothetical protein